MKPLEVHSFTKKKAKLVYKIIEDESNHNSTEQESLLEQERFRNKLYPEKEWRLYAKWFR